MKKPFTMFHRLMLLALALGTGFTSRSQTVPQPVALTGFNADIVANGTGNTTAGSSSNSSVDANSYVFISTDYTTTTTTGFFHPTAGLPYGRTFLGAASPNVLYKLPSYSGNNSLRLYGVGGTASPVATAVGTLSFVTPAPAGALYVLATSGSGSDATTAVVNFSDGTSQTFSITVADWFSGSPTAIAVNDRVLITGTNFDDLTNYITATNPRLYQYPLAISAANSAKNITGVTFTKSTAAGSYVQVMAISAAPPVTNNYTTMALTFPATGTPAVYSGGVFTSATSNGQDVIANGLSGNTYLVGTSPTPTTPYTNTSATADTDGAGYFLVATDYNKSTAAHDQYGLPVNGINGVTTPTGQLSSLSTSSLNYQLANYNGINALQLRGGSAATPNTGSISFASTAPNATEVYVLTTSTNSGTVTGGTMSVNFSDGSYHTYTVSYTNWFSTVSTTATQTSAGVTVGVNAKGRLQPPATAGSPGSVSVSTTTPYLFENKLLLAPSEYTKTITSITIANTTASNALSVLAVSLNANTASVAQCSLPSTHSAVANVAQACPATSIVLNLNDVPAAVGYTYQWQYSSDDAAWADLPTTNATGPYSTTGTAATCTVLNQQASMYYRCKIYCAFYLGGAGASIGSPSTSVQVTQNDAVNCFPFPNKSTSGCASGTITAVKIAETATPANVVMNKTGLACGSDVYPTYSVFRDANANGTLDKSKGYTLTVTVGNAARVGVWLDLNENGVYDNTTNAGATPAGEYFGSVAVTAAGTVTFTVPAAALATASNGVVGLRVRSELNSASVLNTAANNNATTVFGMTLDYAVVVAGAIPCAGTPAATTPTASSSTVCPASTFTLTAAGPALGTTGLTYLWEYKLSSAGTYAAVPASFTDVNGSAVATNNTSATVTVTNQQAATDYRVTITCTNGGASATSPAKTIAQSALANCYCQNSNNATSEYITNVTLKDINNTSGSSQSNTPTGYISYASSPTATQTTTLNRGASYTISVTGLSASTTPTEMIWIDYNQSGTFDASEYQLIGTQSSTGTVTGTVTFTIPLTAALGDTRMRVRFHNDATGTSASACTNAWNGETEDYKITIGAEVPCSTPTPLTVSSGPSGGPCSGVSFTLTASGASVGQSGLTYQWQKRIGAAAFADISGATSLTLTTSQTTTTDYRIVTTCANGGATATSATSTVVLGYINCYCTPTNNGATNEYVDAVTVAGNTTFSNGPTGGTSLNGTGYNNYTGNASYTTSLNQGGTYPVTVTIKTNASPSQGALWIDFDHSGTFDNNSDEYYVLGTPALSGTYTYTVNVTVPATAPLGPTRMRVRERNSSFSGTDACATAFSGETEDYLITVSAPQGCTAPPATVTATSSVTNACSSTAFTLSTSSIPNGISGFTYQWQSSPAGAGTFTAISGATNYQYSVLGQTSATDYRLIVSCANGGSPVTSNVVSVGQNTYDQCYCSVTHGSGCGSIGNLTNVTFNTTLNNTTTCGSSPYQTVVPAATATTTVNAGSSYSLATSFTTSTTISAGVWIDYDHSGSFDASEFTAITTSAGSTTLTTSIAIPVNALGGTTRMRIRTESTGVAQVTATRACDTFVYGETEDYTITITAAPVCSSPLPTFTATANQTAVCTSTSIVLTSSYPNGSGNLAGLTYQWQRRNSGSGTFANISGATTNPYTVTGQTVASDYRVVVTCAAGSTSANSNTVTVGQNGFISCYCTPVTSGIGTDGITNVTLSTLNSASSATNASPYYTDYASTQTAGTLAIPTLLTGSTATVSIAMGSDPNQYSGVWIDFDHSGTFDTGEFFTLGTNAGSSGTSVITITIPNGALTGQTKMRVRGGNDVVLLSTQSCTAASSATNYGEVEDYLVTIAVPMPCTGTPPVATATANKSQVCSTGTNPVTLTASGIAFGTTGLTYQWESRMAGSTGAYTAITGATTSPYTVANQTASTEYRVQVSCTASAQTTPSSAVTVTNSYLACYCTPTGGACTNEYIRKVAIGTLANNGSGTTGTGCTSGGYADYTADAALTPTLMKGTTYPMTVSLRVNSNPAAAGVWIDYDHSGAFEPGEYTELYRITSANANLDVDNVTVNISIPGTALTGLTRMRLRSANSSVPLPVPASMTTAASCPTNYFGEVEDYLVNISGDLMITTGTTATPVTIPAGSYTSIMVTGTGVATFGGAVTMTGPVTVQNGGVLNDGCQTLSGSGAFTVAAGGTLGVCSTAGISASGATGAVQMSGTRSFSNDANYVYNGTGGGQLTGSGLPTTVRNLTLNNADGLTLSQPLAVRQVARLSNGDLDTGGQMLTLLSTIGYGTALVDNTGGSVLGTATMQRAVEAVTDDNIGYHHYSSAVASTPIEDLQTPGFSFVLNPSFNSATLSGQTRPYPTVFGYNEARLATSPATDLTTFDKGFFSPTSGDLMGVGKGYTASIPNALKVDFVGTLNNGPVNITGLTRGAAVGSPDQAGWQLMGNPYPSPLNWATVTAGQRTNLDAAVYVYHATSRYSGFYTTYLTNGLVTNGVNNVGTTTTQTDPIIDAGTGFFARVSTQGTGALNLTNTNRVTTWGNQANFGRSSSTLLTLQVRGAAGTDALHVYPDAAATTGLDAEYDAPKLPNSNGLNLAALAGTTPLAIDGLPALTTTTVVPLTLGVPTAGTYTLEVATLANFGSTQVYLRDAVAGTEQLLTSGARVPVALSNVATATTRFSLVFRPSGALATANALAAETSLYPNPAHGRFTVLLPPVAGAKEAQATLLNALGQVVSTRAIALNGAGATAEFSTTSLAKGVYVLRLQAGSQTTTRRVVVE